MKTKTAAATVGHAALFLHELAKALRNKQVAQQVQDAAAALAEVKASLKRKAQRRERQFTVRGFTTEVN